MPPATGFNLNLVSETNRLRVLGLIREKGRISRTDLSPLAGLSLPAVSRIVAALVEQGYVHEVGPSDSRGGRRPIMVEMIPDAGFAVGVDLGRDRILAAGVDMGGSLLEVVEGPVRPSSTMDALIAAIRQVLRHLGPERRKRLLGIGVGTPGLLDFSSGVVITAANLGWKNVPLRKELQSRFRVPAFVDNDANVAALAEWSQGAGKAVSDLIYLTVSRGLGAGVLINGQIYRGVRGIAGEIGETFMTESGSSSSGWLTLEDLCSGRALVAQASEALRRGGHSVLSGGRKAGQPALSLMDILNAASGGDPLAVRLVNRAVNYLGVGIANIVNIFDPELVIVGGDLALAGEDVLRPIREELDRLLSGANRPKVQVLPGTLGDQAAVLGAASLVLHYAFAPPLAHSGAPSLLTV